jgi:phosphoribosylaminoimidazole-succinocarboxamide synthase
MTVTTGAALPAPCLDVRLALPGRREGKVRVGYELDDDRLLFATTDRLSAFDRVVAGVPFKGQVLNQLAWWWFDTTADLVANHALAQPDPNALVARRARPLPVEVIVRAHITGSTSTSLWQRYAAGQRHIDGYALPDGLRKHDELRHPVVTPTTKAEMGGHDEPLSCADVVARGLVAPALWDQVVEVALAIFERGRREAERAGLVLADTKYEFGLDAADRLLLIDEVHTPDSSRLWVASSLTDRLAAGDEPESLDKEPVRLALAAAGFRGDGELPQLDPAVWIETSRRYVAAFEMLTGERFVPGAYPVQDRLTTNLTEAGLLHG